MVIFLFCHVLKREFELKTASVDSKMHWILACQVFQHHFMLLVYENIFIFTFLHSLYT